MEVRQGIVHKQRWPACKSLPCWLPPVLPCPPLGPLHSSRAILSPLPSMGGVQEGLVVELSNGGRAVVTAATSDAVVLDANAMLAGQSVAMDLHLTHIVRPA